MRVFPLLSRGGNKVHIPDSNLLETKDYETYVCHHPGQPFSVPLAYYVWANSLKHMSIKPGLMALL